MAPERGAFTAAARLWPARKRVARHCALGDKELDQVSAGSEDAVVDVVGVGGEGIVPE